MNRWKGLCLITGCALCFTSIPVQAATLQEILLSDNSMSGIAPQTQIMGVSGNSAAEGADEKKEGETGSSKSLLDQMAVGSALIGSGITNQASAGTSKKEEPDSAEAPGEENGTAIEDAPQTMAAESSVTVEDVLGTPVGANVVLVSNKTAQDYAEAYEKAKNANWGYTNLGIADVEKGNLNVRASAAEDGKLVGKMPKDAACEVLDSDGSWAHIKSGKVEGYVSCDYLLTGISAKRRAQELAVTMATVVTDSLNVRAEANTDSEVITLVPNGEELEVVDVEGDWVRVFLDDEEVFVSAEYVEVSSELGTAVTMTELLYGQGVSDVRVDLCQYAKEFLGNPYVWGGTSLTNGADCSGYVMSIYKKYGISLPHSSRAQANCGTTIKVSEAKPGDLIFYGKGNTINHVGIYIGGGQVIHASSPKTGIRISNVSYRSPIKAVRILQDV